MLNRVIAFSLKNRALVVIATVLVLIVGGYQTAQLPVDVFPDLNRPTVTIMTEAHGLAPEEVETLVTFPIESTMNGASGVRRVRSASGIGISIVWVEFDWGTDIYIDRQVVAEKLQLARERLPAEARPAMAPITSIMGEIMLVGMHSTGKTSMLEVRTFADWVVRRRLLAISGVSQITVMGGELKQYQVLTSPERLAQFDVTLDQLTDAVSRSNTVMGGGFLMGKDKESLIRIIGRATSLDEIKQTVVRAGNPVPIAVGQVADVRFAGPVKRGEGSVGGEPAVIMSIQKQPGADTLLLTADIENTLNEIQATLPDDVVIDQHVFKQATFIESAIGNVEEAIMDGAFWVIVVVFLFLWNLRTSAITIIAIPLSVIITGLVFWYFGISINTMTLGGIAVAIGELVDDSIVDIENIYRRLKENRQKMNPDNAFKVIFLASAEVRNSIVYATLIVVLVVFPLFSLAGLEGRMFAPLGLAYMTTLLSSLLVSLTVTPALASYLLPNAAFLSHAGDPALLRLLKWLDTKVLRFTLRHSTAVLAVVTVIVVVTATTILGMGGEFLPDFNEGTLTIGATAPPGTNLAESDRIGRQVEKLLLGIPEVTHVARRTGRAELDEHAENVNFSEIDVTLLTPEEPLPGWHRAMFRGLPGLHWLGVEKQGREREAVLTDIRDTLGEVPGVVFNIGQPISHRLDHIMSGIRAQVAVKIFGQELDVLRDKAYEVARMMADVDGVVDLAIEPQVEIPQVTVTVRREQATRYGLTPDAVAEAMETALQGRTVSQVLEGQRTFDLVVWFDETARNNVDVIRSTLISTPSGAQVSLGNVADVLETTGPNTINRENVTRRIVVQANTAGRDLVSVVRDVQEAVASKLKLDEGYFIEYGGQFEAQSQANRQLVFWGSLSIIGVFLLLWKCLESWRAALQVMVNVPLAAVGAIVALLLTNWPSAEAIQQAPWWDVPRVWFQATTLSVAHWVGFITLVGIVIRNGIMMISHYIHLMRFEGEKFDKQMIVRGSLERLSPVLMTALCACIGLVPLALGAGQTGKEILHPLAIVVIGGLLSSTLLDQIVTPALFFKFGRKVYEGRYGAGDEREGIEEADALRIAAQFR
jgi:CzcA family heavy metal efflux pump